jgi:hypothetical protein
MKTCPQCNTIYDEDYLFCLADGNTLRDESGEQETVLSDRIVFSNLHEAGVFAGPAFCTTCGLQNRGNSKFCKQCGGSIAAAPPPGFVPSPAANQPFGFAQSPGSGSSAPGSSGIGDTVMFQPSVFTPPAAASTQYAASNGKNQTTIVIVAGLICLTVIVGALIFISRSDSNRAGSSSNASNTANRAANTATNAAVAINAPSIIGRRGHLTTNQRIHSDSNRYAEIIGVHYQGARIEIVDERTISQEDGFATWYKVRVLENGCDREGRLGCGNDLNGMSGQAAMEGWMNSKFIGLD